MSSPGSIRANGETKKTLCEKKPEPTLGVKTNPNKKPMTQTDKLKEAQQQVAEITSIMRHNVEKIMDRGTKLEHLQEKTERLEGSAENFQKVSSRVHRAMWWKDMKMCIILSSMCGLIILALTIWLCIRYVKK